MSLLILAGPTASGKSAVAVELAVRIGAEIIAADSMQVYRGLDILSAKPSATDRARVPHHCLDIASISEDFTVAQWLASARAATNSIRGRGRVPLVVGGTGLYIRALRFGLDPNPPTPPQLRDALSARSLPDLVTELRQADPEAAERIDLRNRRRVERALAIALQGSPSTPASWATAPEPFTLVILRRDPHHLRARIEARVDAMFEAGAIDEVRRLKAAGLRPGATASQALGIRQIEEFLAGRCAEPDARASLTTATRQFAKRQMTWFRRETGTLWLDVPPDELPTHTAARIVPEWAPGSEWARGSALDS
ncbi:MAG TPA: tRNA (adenosine(37)-N6)-dimethylallyltransferase MiaA [Verrucomicrobiae bacterium]|nr:tRNA (adenosine(37)-N6)-dimethylallyltransferase MiaA [Verrucomicrobiae bacterium]